MLFDFRKNYSLLGEIKTQLRMELFRRNTKVQRLVVIMGNVVRAYLG
jgi:hypothetical protein